MEIEVEAMVFELRSPQQEHLVWEKHRHLVSPRQGNWTSNSPTMVAKMA